MTKALRLSEALGNILTSIEPLLASVENVAGWGVPVGVDPKLNAYMSFWADLLATGKIKTTTNEERSLFPKRLVNQYLCNQLFTEALKRLNEEVHAVIIRFWPSAEDSPNKAFSWANKKLGRSFSSYLAKKIYCHYPPDGEQNTRASLPLEVNQILAQQYLRSRLPSSCQFSDRPRFSIGSDHTTLYLDPDNKHANSTAIDQFMKFYFLEEQIKRLTDPQHKHYLEDFSVPFVQASFNHLKWQRSPLPGEAFYTIPVTPRRGKAASIAFILRRRLTPLEFLRLKSITIRLLLFPETPNIDEEYSAIRRKAPHLRNPTLLVHNYLEAYARTGLIGSPEDQSELERILPKVAESEEYKQRYGGDYTNWVVNQTKKRIVTFDAYTFPEKKELADQEQRLRREFNKTSSINFRGRGTRILVLGPHSDDIELGMAITLKYVISAGAEVFYRVIAKHPSSTHRAEEARAAARRLGIHVDDPLHFDADGIVPDGHFKELKNINKIKNYIARVNQIVCPHLIFVNFAPHEGIGEYHPDHLSLCRIVQELAPNHPGLMYYPVMAYTTGNDMGSFQFLVPFSEAEDFEFRVEVTKCFASQQKDVYFDPAHQRAFFKFGLERLHGIDMAERFMASTLTPIVLGWPNGVGQD